MLDFDGFGGLGGADGPKEVGTLGPANRLELVVFVEIVIESVFDANGGLFREFADLEGLNSEEGFRRRSDSYSRNRSAHEHKNK